MRYELINAEPLYGPSLLQGQFFDLNAKTADFNQVLAQECPHWNTDLYQLENVQNWEGGQRALVVQKKIAHKSIHKNFQAAKILLEEINPRHTQVPISNLHTWLKSYLSTRWIKSWPISCSIDQLIYNCLLPQQILNKILASKARLCTLYWNLQIPVKIIDINLGENEFEIINYLNEEAIVELLGQYLPMHIWLQICPQLIDVLVLNNCLEKSKNNCNRFRWHYPKDTEDIRQILKSNYQQKIPYFCLIGSKEIKNNLVNIQSSFENKKIVGRLAIDQLLSLKQDLNFLPRNVHVAN